MERNAYRMDPQQMLAAGMSRWCWWVRPPEWSFYWKYWAIESKMGTIAGIPSITGC
jgi:hypothetical protein